MTGMVDEKSKHAAHQLAAEYQALDLRARALRRQPGDTTTAELMHIEAREVEIVDMVRALDLPPEILTEWSRDPMWMAP